MSPVKQKEPIFSELDIHDCKIIDIAYYEDGSINAILISHQLLKLSKWFSVSKKGNLYSLLPEKKSDPHVYGFIIKNWREKEELNVG